MFCFQRYRYRALAAERADGRSVDLAASAAALLHLERSDPSWEREVALRLPPDIGKFLCGGRASHDLAEAALELASRTPVPLGIAGEPLLINPREVRLLPPVTAPLILSNGAVFRDGRSISSPERPGHREFFMRNPHNVLGPSDCIALPAGLGEMFDVMPRVAVIIGQRLNRASAGEAAAGVFGYCAALELRARDLEKISWAGPMFHVQYTHARTFDGSLMLGARVVTRGEVGNVANRTARLSIDGASVFDGTVPGRWEDLVEWICQLSEVVTLEPGTLLIPGAADDTVVHPAGSAEFPAEIVSRPSARREVLRSGASITLDIEGIGGIETSIA